MSPAHSETRPLVSVIIPARNEEDCLARCLRSLQQQEGVTHEIIVVDDNSTDSTRAIAGGVPGVRVIDAGPLPARQSGKTHAAQVGADAARGEWLLFTDADTFHLPGSLARSVAEAREHQAALLSYSPAQELHGPCERIIMPLIFAELAVTYPPKQVSDPASPVAAANGQYMLITRAAYNRAGGHAALGLTLLEDVALAEVVKRQGGQLRFRYGGDAVRTRMYRTFTALCDGWTKNLALLFPETLRLALKRGVEFLLILAGIGALVAGVLLRNWYVAAAGLVIATPT